MVLHRELNLAANYGLHNEFSTSIAKVSTEKEKVSCTKTGHQGIKRTCYIQTKGTIRKS